jgi:hypothetical protein
LLQLDGASNALKLQYSTLEQLKFLVQHVDVGRFLFRHSRSISRFLHTFLYILKDIKKINVWNSYAITLCICHLPDTNFWHYALQLNTYKAILENKYNKKVKELFLVRLHPDSEEKSYELIKIPDLKKEINDLFLERKNEIQKQNT